MEEYVINLAEAETLDLPDLPEYKTDWQGNRCLESTILRTYTYEHLTVGDVVDYTENASCGAIECGKKIKAFFYWNESPKDIKVWYETGGHDSINTIVKRV